MNILLVDDKEGIYSVMRENFEFTGHTLLYSASQNECLKTLNSQKIDVVLLDIMLGQDNGVETLKLIKKRLPDLPVIMITGYATVETAVLTMKLGAFDYLKKPLKFERLSQLTEKAYDTSRIKKENKALKERMIEDLPPLSSLNPHFSETISRARKLASTDFPLLIQGENGTGKELLVDYIYRHSNRVAEKLNKINCAAFTESLLDNELFGHEKGAYTGASSSFKGIFEQSDNGTLFLDEIGDMPETIQVKILRVLQNQEVRRIGGDATTKINVRFIGATNKNLEKMISKGDFREDLYYRLNTAILRIPPLRERLMDLPALTNYFLTDFSRKNNQDLKTLSPEVDSLFKQYKWPGNIRELKNVLNYAATICSSNLIGLIDLPPSIRFYESDSAEENAFSLRENQEMELIKKTLSLTGSNKSESARILNMSRNTLYQKMKKYGIA